MFPPLKQAIYTEVTSVVTLLLCGYPSLNLMQRCSVYKYTNSEKGQVFSETVKKRRKGHFLVRGSIPLDVRIARSCAMLHGL